jgi:hypothetical protein
MDSGLVSLRCFWLIDPFCGRGTTPFVAAVTGRDAFGADINPVAWIYSSVKLDPCERSSLVMRRVTEILKLVTPRDREPRNTFQELAWNRDVLGFLHAARRHLNWESNRIDRTLMALTLVHLHAKKPPKIDLMKFFEEKLRWRYKNGIPVGRGTAVTVCGDAREILSRIPKYDADFILTSPPYFGVTNYSYDNWIRLWMLGGPALPYHSAAARYAEPEAYEDLITEVFTETKRLAKDKALVYVRTDARQFTLETTIDALAELWPSHRMSIRFDTAPGRTQTGLFQNSWHKAGEVDILMTPRSSPVPRSFYRS